MFKKSSVSLFQADVMDLKKYVFCNFVHCVQNVMNRSTVDKRMQRLSQHHVIFITD